MNEIEPSEIRQYKNGEFRHIIKKKFKCMMHILFPSLQGTGWTKPWSKSGLCCTGGCSWWDSSLIHHRIWKLVRDELGVGEKEREHWLFFWWHECWLWKSHFIFSFSTKLLWNDQQVTKIKNTWVITNAVYAFWYPNGLLKYCLSTMQQRHRIYSRKKV